MHIQKLTQSITFKAIVIATLAFIMLIPGFWIQNLIEERQERSMETISSINDKWSDPQIICGPILAIPYATMTYVGNQRIVDQEHTLYIVPEELEIETVLLPEEKHYGIYKTILYKSQNRIKGTFGPLHLRGFNVDSVYWDRVHLQMNVSDLKGMSSNLEINFDGKSYTAYTATGGDPKAGYPLVIVINGMKARQSSNTFSFDCQLNLNGSHSITYIPVAKTTTVHATGAWRNPSFVGDFSPEFSPVEGGFDARWSVLSFNRDIPDSWIDGQLDTSADIDANWGTNTSHAPRFGVYLLEMVDHYQQNMRSAKYASLFILLTFGVFFFVELLTKLRIHPIQYLLVAAALLLFYTLLLSISEQIGFGLAYLIASVSIVGLITAYAHSIFRNKKPTAILAFILSLLYLFLYVILQLEDIALLIGSIGLFIILSIAMYASRKISWYKTEDAA